MSSTVKVGMLVVGALALLAYFILRIEHLDLFGGSAGEVEVAFDSVAGLDDKAAVRVAGVRVGRVDGIRLEDGRAVVTLRLETPVELHRGAGASIANLGLLGDKFIDLRTGDRSAPVLGDDTVLPGRTPLGWDEAMSRIGGIGESIETTLSALDPEQTGESLQRLLTSMETTIENIRVLVETNQDQVSSTISNMETFSASLSEELPRLTRQMERVLVAIEEVVAENRGSVKKSLDELAESAADFRSSMRNLDTISTRIASGEGTIGKLLNSDETHDQLVSTLDSVETGVRELGDTLGRVRRIGLDLGVEAFYLENLEETRSSLQLTFNPESERSYHLALVDDPRGRVRREEVVETVTLPDGTVETTTTELVRIDDKETISAQVGFNLGKASFRAGIFESSGGAALDYRLFSDRLALTLEAYDFRRQEDLDPHIRFLTRWRLGENVYLLGGYDDFLESELESVFIGAGITWRDDDLKYLLGSLPGM
jgi:phospholipid/cholesterol/gamma-HCH transport system substrate-binding protein